jgi:hypothetical protein
MKSGRVCINRTVVLGTVAALYATAGSAADHQILIKRLGQSISCPKQPFIVDGTRYQYLESYAGDETVFRLNRDVKFTRVTDNVNVNDYTFETVSFRFSDLDKIEVHGDEISLSCKSSETCIANTSTLPEARQPAAAHEGRYRACDQRTAEDIKIVLEALRSNQ